MKKIIMVVWFVVLLWGDASALTYHVDSEGGNDSYDGLTVNTPWKSIGRVRNYKFEPGDSLLFKKGGIWRDYLYINVSGESGRPIVFGAYGEGNKPILSALDEISRWKEEKVWKEIGGDIWKMECSKDPRRLFVDGKEVLRSHPLSEVDGLKAKWYYGCDTLFLYSKGNPALTLSSLKGNKLYYNVKISGQQHLILEDLDIQGGVGNALSIFGCGHVTVKNCNIGCYAWIGVRIRSCDNAPSHHISIMDNIVDSGFRFYYGPPEKRGVEDGVLLSGGAHHCLIENNKIMDWGHCSVYCYALYEGDHGVYDNVIRNNIITGDHISYCRGIGTDGREGLCSNNLFYNNLIKNTTVRNQINGNDNWVHHNIIDGIKNSPVKSGATAQGFDLQCYGDNMVCHDNRIDNNTIMNCDEAGVRLRADKNDKKNNLVRNNIIYQCGGRSKDRIGRDSLRGYGIVIDGHESVEGNVFYNNCVFSEGIENVIYYRGEGMSVQSFNERNGFMGDSLKDNIQENPLLDDGIIKKYFLKSASPCIDKGLFIGLTEDYNGDLVPAGIAPDMGALEYQKQNGAWEGSRKGQFSNILHQNHPNPFRVSTVVSYELGKPGLVEINLYNILGEKVRTLLKKRKEGGKHEIILNKGELPAGMYICSLIFKGRENHIKIIILK